MNERGSITIWMLGLVLILFGLGGIVLDLWRVLGTRADLALLADSAAVAATSALDEDALRADGTVLLVADDAHHLAGAVLAADPPARSRVQVEGATATVIAETDVPLTLLAVLVPDDRPITVRVMASADAQVRP